MRLTNQLPPIDEFDVAQFIRMTTFDERHGMSYDEAVEMNESEFGTAQEAEIIAVVGNA